VEEVAGEFAGRAKFVKVDLSEAMDVAAQYGVFAAPTLLFFKEGHPVDKLQGVTPKPTLKQRVTALVEG
jgi:thioredoxin 1